MVCGCHIGDCHYMSGNHKTMVRMPLMRRILEDIGIEPERFRHEWVSAAEGEKFSKLVTEMTEQVRQLGPLNWPKLMRERGVGHGQDLQAMGRVSMGRGRRARPTAKLKVGMYWASSCGGCDISLLEIGPRILDLIQIADVVFWPCAADFKYKARRGLPRWSTSMCASTTAASGTASRRKWPDSCARSARR